MRTYLVTGGAGFIGSNYIHYMFKKYGDEIRIINVDALTYATGWFILRRRAMWTEASVARKCLSGQMF